MALLLVGASDLPTKESLPERSFYTLSPGKVVEKDELGAHEPRMKVVQLRESCGSIKADPAAIGPEATAHNASACRTSARWALRLARACRGDRRAQRAL